MSSHYEAPCPKCGKTAEFNFCNNNGYVAVCGECKLMLYYCAIFSKITVAKPTGEEFEMQFNEMKLVIED